MKVFEVSKFYGGIYSAWIPDAQVVQSMDNADLVLFKGGEDVNPSLYGEEPHATTYINRMRDDYEKQIYNAARKMDKKILGVCRGAQFISVMNGAKLFQHIHGHGQAHMCIVEPQVTGKEKLPVITSTHHQCLDIYSAEKNPEFKLHGFAFGHVDNQIRLEKGLLEESQIIPEFYQFGNHSLCIQSHPEFVREHWKKMSSPDAKYADYMNYCITLLNQFMNEK